MQDPESTSIATPTPQTHPNPEPRRSRRLDTRKGIAHEPISLVQSVRLTQPASAPQSGFETSARPAPVVEAESEHTLIPELASRLPTEGILQPIWLALETVEMENE